MFKILNYVIIHVIQFIPKSIIKIFANPYVAGTTIEESLKIIKSLNNSNLSATLDILGEHTKTTNESSKITNDYIKILTQIKNENLDCNISLKPSHIGTDISIDLFRNNLQDILNYATQYNNFIRIDMENSKLTDISLNTYNNIRSDNIGIVLQAYLFRTYDDLNNLDIHSNIRLCKGIYNENPKIAIKNPSQINDNYLKLLEVAFKKELYVGIATHDITLIDGALSLINKMNISKDNFEFQMLYGVPMQHTIKHLIKNQYKVRIYVPFGPLWYDYSIRRIKENPDISKYIIKNIFSKIKEAL